MKKAKVQEFQASVTRDGFEWGEYVSVGADYTVTPPAGRGGSYYFRNNATGGGTYVQPWAYSAAVKRGDVVVGA